MRANITFTGEVMAKQISGQNAMLLAISPT
jgi:hypothetical protein